MRCKKTISYTQLKKKQRKKVNMGQRTQSKRANTHKPIQSQTIIKLKRDLSGETTCCEINNRLIKAAKCATRQFHFFFKALFLVTISCILWSWKWKTAKELWRHKDDTGLWQVNINRILNPSGWQSSTYEMTQAHNTQRDRNAAQQREREENKETATPVESDM